ncbi:midasin [Physcia stellaris]|nr:midasin [Physcia stellaris]
MPNDVLRTLESVSVAMQMNEPCLLVGETGTGKTALVQHLATLSRIKLNVINLSQQSEAGDLLGGYKPVSLGTLGLKMMRTFEELFNVTFSTKRNERYIDSVTKAVEKRRWSRVLAFWHEALQTVQSTFGSNRTVVQAGDQEPRSKKRRMEISKHQALKSRWADFESEVRVFQMHLASGSKGFAFSFVEGNIVKAARHGDWILLDEINLASPDALESLADLLSDESDGGPSLLLSESGRAERIYAHKNFRVFAAMNPATDIGKRDLPVGLRSRFTEIFISSPDSQFESLVLVIKEYLGGHSNVDTRAAADVANLYLAVKQLTEQNTIIDGSGQKPHFSLRTLTRTLLYVRDIAHIYGLRRSLFEGFSMSFLTLLSAESGLQVLSLIENYILGSQKNGRAYMKQIPRPPEDKKKYVQFKHYWIAQGESPLQEQPHYILTPFVERNLLNLVRATSTRRFPVLLQGPTSSGKTSMIEYLANISGNKFLRVNNHEHTDIQEYLGTYTSNSDGSLSYKEGILVRALREGSWIVLDELNLAPTDVLEALNRLLDDNKELFIPETQETVRPHENFMLFATQNPPGSYGGRKILSRAFRSRFLELHFDDIPEEELETILRERCQIAPSFCTRIVAVYQKLSVVRQKGRLFEQKNSFATLRDLFRWALREANDREQLAINGFLLLAERVRDDEERALVKRVIEEVMKVKIDENAVYDVCKIPEGPSHGISMKSKTVWTGSMVRSYVLVTEALKHNEPVLLVGDTGSGKTTVCQIIADHMGKQLYTLNAHQNMDTSDLIGSQRPVRSKAQLELQLARDLARILNVSTSDVDGLHDLPALLSIYDALPDQQAQSEISPEIRLGIQADRLRCAALFEWADGSIVQAMRAGQHFLLDEISLADDSVLERLNSVLEPSRTLFLAEKATDSAPIIASHGFQMYATMNPGGDYGKKELSPALRNRFTEIWVPPIQDVQELVGIACVKLDPLVVEFATPMIAFATWYSARYSPIAPSVSIRDLLSWLEFVNKFSHLDIHFSICHGAAMVYIDGLGADPAAKTWASSNSIHYERGACLARLRELFRFDMDSIYRQQLPMSISEGSLKIGPFHLSVHEKVPEDPSYSLDTPTTKNNIMKIVRALQVNKSILLEGSPGVGKTTLITAIAKAIGIPLTRINLSDQTDLTDLFGSDVPLEGEEAGHFGWHQAPFLRAMQKGEWVLLDEMNLASQSVLEGLNACLDHRGQAYVSELDQTFFRHDDFVVFAAQNPRHQGGGRKGLPASFVNRFTVVYIEDFQSDDLLLICSKAFQNCAEHLIPSIVECVTAVSAYLQSSPKVGLQGGPWEFNLRDAFRWLHLVTSRDMFVSTSHAADYLALIFLHRLRMSEDRALISALLDTMFPGKVQTHSLFLNVGKEHLQVGLGILPRNSQLRVGHAEGSFVNELDLSALESIMICVQNKWPCLLVGPSGSGKTHAINSLARIVGAEIVTVALNPETDIIDLIGGFEQADPQRRLKNAIGKMKRLARQSRANNLLSGNTDLSCVDRLEGHLQHSAPDMVQVGAILRQCAQSIPSTDFDSLAEELEDALPLAHEDRKARFQWVDGLLINALKRGAWLVLDNANLCSPSILDRLNSLLEPNGFLNINEHRNADGTNRVVEPHANFRLFLTVDPRHGELSRAMRNRSVELFLRPTNERHRPSLTLEASLARYAIFNKFDWESLEDTYSGDLFSVCCDHLAFSDISLSSRWSEQVERGLIHIAPSPHVSSIMQTYNRMLGEHAKFFQRIQACYQGFVESSEMKLGRVDISRSQTLHPLNNPLHIKISAENRFTSDLSLLGSTFDLLWRVCSFQERVERLKVNASMRLSSSEFLEEIFGILHQALAWGDYTSVDRTQLEVMEKVLLYAEDLSKVAERSPFDEATFQTFQSIGRSMVDDIIQGSAYYEIAESFSNALSLFDDSCRLTSGLSMERIWNSLSQPAANHASLLALRIGTEELSDRFDALSWRSEASLHELATLRSSIIKIFKMLEFSDANSKERLKDAHIALEDLEIGQHSAGPTTAVPLFRFAFEGLLQYSQCAEIGSATAEIPLDPVLPLLACQPTRDSLVSLNATNMGRLLCLAEKFSGIAASKNALTVVRDTLGISILQRLASVQEVPLQAFEMLRTELGILANRTATMTSYLSKNHLHTMESILIQIHSEIIHIHNDFLEPVSLASYEAFVNKFVTKSISSDLQPAPTLQVKAKDRGTGYFHEILERNLNPSLAMLHRASSYRAAECNREHLATVAASWIQLFTGCLVLYVPDRIFDPAAKPLVEQERHRKRRTELRVKLWALTEFEKKFTGESTSFRSRIEQSRLDALGDEIPVPPVTRPHKPTLGDLQTLLTGLLESVIRNCPTQEDLQHLVSGGELLKPKVELLRANLARFIARMRNGFRLFEDITIPLISLLNGLDVGLVLALIAGERKSPIDKSVFNICHSTPFIAMRPESFAATTISGLRNIVPHADTRLVYLKTTAVLPCLDSISKEPYVSTLFEVFHSFYKEWKKKLSDDQKAKASRSSLYRYRGSEDDQTEETTNDFHEIFPGDEDDDKNGDTEMSSGMHPRTLAQALATCHRDIFDKNKSTERVIGILRFSSSTLGRIPNELVTCPISVENLLPALIVQLDDNCEILRETSAAIGSYNFYKDTNVAESRRLTKLVFEIQKRYSELRAVWPEHATLQDVLYISSQLLAMRHTEPIAKFLTKSEQLHRFMHEWQTVASREFSTASLYEQLTGLLIDWRRLELSTWARLLDNEDSKCSEDVDAWWFVAYEIIIAVPLSIIDADKAVEQHTEQLLGALTEFLFATTIGHYARRLQLIENFKSYIRLLAQKLPAMKTVENALSNFLKFYKRFDKNMHDAILEGRQALERKLKEVLVLASWKDTNINALRESAKRSHQRLFKLIRQYRILLAQPAQQVLLHDLPDPDEITDLPVSSTSVLEFPDLGVPIQLCQENLPQWATRSARFQNPAATARQMAKICQLPASAFKVADYVDTYALELSENIILLRRETPAVKTKENDGLTKHLRARKRKLFTDTLKDIRQMGFQSNISGDALAKQSTLPIILSSTPAFEHGGLNGDLGVADRYWYKLLDNLALVREKSRDPSNDISHVETSRSLGYLESMLKLILKERVVIASCFNDLHQLNNIIISWSALSEIDSVPFVVRGPDTDYLITTVFARISSLPLMLDTGCVLLEKHGRLGNFDNSIITQKLRAWKEKVITLVDSAKNLPKLPGGLSSPLHECTYSQAEGALSELNAKLLEWTQENPAVGFILRQVRYWTEIGTVEASQDRNGVRSVALIDFGNNIANAYDSILVATQQMQTVLSAISSDYEEASWLTRNSKTLSDGLRSLQIGKVNVALDKTMQQMPHIVPSDRQNLKTASAACSLLLPIIQQYRRILQQALNYYTSDHRALCKLASIFAQSFSHIVSQGFCEPAVSSVGEAGKVENLEGGIGLGEGEGAQDISKDVEDDEDLSELAQDKGKREEGSPENVDEAIDMNHDELAGDLEDMSGSQTEEGAQSGEDQDDIDEELGDVNELDPGAVDEKLWDGGAEHPRKEKESDQSTGKNQKDDQRAHEGSEYIETAEDEADESGNEDVGDGEEVVNGEAQKLDSHVQEEENLELPEEMDLDNNDRSDISSLQGSDLDEASNHEQEGIDDLQSSDEEIKSEQGDQLEEHSNYNTNLDEPRESDGDVDEPDKGDAESTLLSEPETESLDQGPRLLPEHNDDAIIDPDNLVSDDGQREGQGTDKQDYDEQTGRNTAEGKQDGQARPFDEDDGQAAAKDGSHASTRREPKNSSNSEAMDDNPLGNQAFQKLGDALEEWHRQQQQIRDAAGPTSEAPPQPPDTEMTEKEFEHLYDENTHADAQALGAATEEQTQALDQRAFDTEINDQPDDFIPDQRDQNLLEDQDQMMKDAELPPPSSLAKHQLPNSSAFVGKSDRQQEELNGPTSTDETIEDIQSVEDESTTPPDLRLAISARSSSEARQLWSHYQSQTHSLSLILTEQLRLILTPTQATKMRGDFRTGKRLNIRRIIPYIASNYKRDKIWMRRSVPQKRNYQIMLAVDDSKSMGESGSGQLAFEALVLVMQSLSMLEVGEIAVVGFGENVTVAHEFDKPFSPEAGVNIIQHFGFKQTKTNVRKLVAESIELFRAARDRAPSSSAAEIWQLMLIISDGLCEDHETIRRLVRQAQEERIMIVFVIVDAMRGESIVDMSQAVFEPDPGGDGGQKLKIKRYLDDFPFTYYLVVGDVKELPGVLATALRSWFSEIVSEAG